MSETDDTVPDEANEEKMDPMNTYDIPFQTKIPGELVTRRAIRDLSEGDRIDQVFLLRQFEVRTTKRGDLYFSMELGDQTGVIPGRLWDADQVLADSLKDAKLIHVNGMIEKYRDALQVNVRTVSRVTPGQVDLKDFLPSTAYDTSELFLRLRGYVATVRNEFIRSLLHAFIDDPEIERALRESPAATSHHHAYLGGLLEHVVSLLEVITRVADTYPRLNRDLLITGAILHDIGKIRELSYEGGFDYTDEGKLLGHLVIGVEQVTERARKIADFPEPLLTMIKHLILSHHGTYEFGSPRLPMTAEAMVLHHVDNMDAKLWAYWNAIDEVPEGDSWTGYIRSMQRRLHTMHGIE